jgi:hypothetical protein
MCRRNVRTYIVSSKQLNYCKEELNIHKLRYTYIQWRTQNNRWGQQCKRQITRLDYKYRLMIIT